MFTSNRSRPHALLHRPGLRLVLAVSLLGATLSACDLTSTSSPAAGPASAAPTTAGQASAAAQNSAPPQAAGTADACALVTRQEATTALGTDPGAGKPRGTSGKSCEFSGPGGLFLGVSFGLNNQTRAQFDAAKAQAQAPYQQQGGTVQDVAGIGDGAWVAATGHGGACEVLKGSVIAQVTVVSPTILASPVDILTSLCRTMGGRL